MRDLIIQVITEESKKLLKESGIRDIKKLAKRYPMAKIYFHQDLDGVTTAIAMKKYLENQGFKVVDCEIIQYGEKEWAIKKPEGEGQIMPVLVDFAHGKPMFEIHTDHHDSQVGVEKETKTSFKHSRSNVETISQTISPKDLFKDEDLYVVSTIDSANFAVNQITTKMVMNFIFKYDKDQSVRRNKMMMGLVLNKLLLAYKNDKVNGKDLLEYLVMKCEPSLENLFNTISNIAKEQGFATPEVMQKNQERYLQDRAKEGVIQREGGVIYQFGLGSMKKGSYDRYTPFDLHPDADFLVTGLGAPVGLVQASCNPYKADRELKGVDLGKIKDEVLLSFKPELDQVILPYKIIKKVSEKKATKDSVGFTQKDMDAIYGNMPSYNPETNTINAYDYLVANAGGHKCITTISGIGFVYSGYDKPYVKDLPEEAIPIAFYEGSNKFIQDIKQKLLRFRKLSEKQIQSAISGMKREGIDVELLANPKQGRGTTELTKDIRDKFVEILNEKIKSFTKIQEKYITKKQILTSPTSILLNPKNLIKEQKISLPIIIKDGYSAPKGDADALHSFERRKKDGFGGKMTTKIGEKLKEIYDAGINPDVVNINIMVDSKNYTVQWEATLDESQDGNAYMGVSTRGSAGGDADIRALGQVGPLKKELEKNGARNITQVLDFDNKTGVKIRQYFFKYTLPEKYPPHETSQGLYTKTNKPSIINLSNDKSTETNQKQSVGDFLNFGKLTSSLGNILKQKFGSLFGSEETSDEDDTRSTQTSTATVSQTSGSDSDFMEITKKVIANFEGGYWNGSTSKNESTSKLGICKNHPKGSMGASTETMFGLDRYNGNIESTPEGKQFFEIIDNQKEELGIDAFCKKWKWLYRGGENEEELKELAAQIMKKSFDRNMSNFVKDQEVKDKIMKNKGLLVHMTYACWNGPGFFKKFANELTDAVKQGKSDSELIDVAINSRANTKLLNKDKVAAAIKNPDGMKTA